MDWGKEGNKVLVWFLIYAFCILWKLYLDSYKCLNFVCHNQVDTPRRRWDVSPFLFDNVALLSAKLFIFSNHILLPLKINLYFTKGTRMPWKCMYSALLTSQLSNYRSNFIAGLAADIHVLLLLDVDMCDLVLVLVLGRHLSPDPCLDLVVLWGGKCDVLCDIEELLITVLQYYLFNFILVF